MTERPPTLAPPPTLAQRTRALGQGAAGVVGGVGVFVLAAFAADKAGSAVASRLLMTAGFVGGLVATLLGVAKLSFARTRRWDAQGLAAFVLLLFGYPLFFLFAMWTAIGLYAIVTGQPIAPYPR